MIDFDTFQGISWLAWLAIAGILTAFIYIARRSIFGLLDPWFPIIFNQFIYIALLSILFFNNILKFSDYIYWIVSTLLFFLPFALIKCKIPIVDLPSSRSRYHSKLVNLIIILLSGYQVTVDLVFIVNRGVPALYEFGSNPQIYLGGFGIVKYIHDACKYVIPPLAVFSLFATGKRSLFFLALFITLYPALLFEWSKVGVLTVLMYYWISALYFFGRTATLRKITTAGLSLAALFTLFMFSRVAATGYGENTMDALSIRLVQSIDSGYFYFIRDAQTYIPKDFTFSRYIFSLVAPFLGGDASGSSVGQTLLLASGVSAEDGYGPSPPFQIIGHIFLKEYGLVYAMLLGWGLALMKSSIGSLKQERAILFLIVYNVAPVLAGDASLFLYYIFILVFLLPPLALAASMHFALAGMNYLSRDAP